MDAVENIYFLQQLPLQERRDVYLSSFFAVSCGVFSSYSYFAAAGLGYRILSVLFFLIVPLVYLFKHWSVRFDLFCRFRHVKDVQGASHVFVSVKEHHGNSEIVELVKRNVASEYWIYFILQKSKIFFDAAEGTFYEESFANSSLSHVMGLQGLDDSQVEYFLEKYGENQTKLDVPPIKELFLKRLFSPIFVFQFTCCFLWLLYDKWMFAIFALLMMAFSEFITVFQQKVNMTNVRSMQSDLCDILVYRNKKWQHINSSLLVPGDLVHFARTSEKTHLPCDILLLAGSCLLDESTLTGESFPQLKEPVDVTEIAEGSTCNSIQSEHLLSSGTLLLSINSDKRSSRFKDCKTSGIFGVCIRTGFSTTKGKLLKTILYSSNEVTSNNVETFIFLFALFIFAVVAAAYVWIKGTADPARDRYKIFLECLLIVTSVVPPELPMQLSLAINASVLKLVKQKMICTEPYRVPAAGKLDVCFFDKTGTLTYDVLEVEGIVDDKEVVARPHAPQISPLSQYTGEALYILVGCHSLGMIKDVIYGDPIEKAALTQLKVKMTGNDQLSFGRGTSVQIVKRFPFKSKLKRMSTLISVFDGRGGTSYMAVVKGAPETLRDMLCDLPYEYKESYESLMVQGRRVLALGYKSLKSVDSAKLNEMDRSMVECDLKFSGFLVAKSSMKDKAKEVLSEIQRSSHHAMIITGDSPLTASYVAKELNLNEGKEIIILSLDECDSKTQTIHEKLKMTSFCNRKKFTYGINKKTCSECMLCIDGETLRAVLEDKELFSWYLNNILSIKVYARVDPKEKEFVIRTFKQRGFSTLMCGDGTNDMGALRQSDVGVAMLNPAVAPSSELDQISNLHNRRKPTKDNSTIGNNSNPPSVGLATLMKTMKDVSDGIPMIKLGDASMAAPFTSREGLLTNVIDLIKQGRCTLVTTLQMFRVLAVTSLVSAYSQSVHYSHGIRESEKQSIFAALSVTMCSLLLSHAEVAPVLSESRPLPNIFNFYLVTSVLIQAIAHIGTLFYLSSAAFLHSLEPLVFDIEKKFQPNLLNSVIYITSIVLQVTTFLVNYQGRPFMRGLFEHKRLRNAILLTYCFAIMILFEVSPSFNESLEIVKIPHDLRIVMLAVLSSNLLVCFLSDKLLFAFFGKKGRKIA